MADFNSAYTGTEVDAAIAKTATILNFVQVYSGSPTDEGVPISSLSINPDTGDRTGVYDVIYSGTNTSVDSSSGVSFVSRIRVGNEGQIARGTSFAEINVGGNTMWGSNCDYNKDAEQKFKVDEKTYDLNANTGTVSDWFIHKIYRLEREA